MSWFDQLQGQSGNYAPIIQTLTPADGAAFEFIIQVLSAHATGLGKTLEEYVLKGECVNLEMERQDENSPLSLGSIATLKAVGVIMTNDNTHIGLTPLGAGFYQAMNVQP